METSAFVNYIKRFHPGIVLRITKSLNGDDNPNPYLFKTLLRPKYSPDGNWEALSQSNIYVSADYVAMDSKSPLKMRDSGGKASGKIPKQMMELWLNENQLTAIDTMIAQKIPEALILAELFQDDKRVIAGAYELNESTFLEGFSTGLCVVTDAENVGTGIRLDYGYKAANKFAVDKLLTDPTAKIFDRIGAVMKKGKAKGVRVAYTDSDTIAAIASTNQAKEMYAFSQNFVGGNIPEPDLEQMNAVFSKRLGITFFPIDRVITREKNATRTEYSPWKAGMITFAPSGPVGDLVWSRLAEMGRPVAGVEYQTVDQYMLVSKYRKNDPAVSEWTKMQARVAPVISNIDAIFQLDTTLVEE
ncbi:MAG: hypothetical protein Q8R83_06070 [Legionellaceae bacterium]|nr:hypothetical protein [Legionellaceae bacterium]